MEQHICLKFDNTLTGLAGYEYGIEEYDKQVNGKVDLTKEFSLEFPDNIERIASSFIQGFFKEIVKEKGLTGIEENVNIISKINNLKEKIINNLQM